MGKVRIVTDSSAHFLNPDIITRYGIQVIPLTIYLGSQAFREGIDLDADQEAHLGLGVFLQPGLDR